MLEYTQTIAQYVVAAASGGGVVALIFYPVLKAADRDILKSDKARFEAEQAATKLTAARRVLRDAYDRVVDENTVLNRDNMHLLTFKRNRNKSSSQRARAQAAAKVLKVEKTEALRSYANSGVGMSVGA